MPIVRRTDCGPLPMVVCPVVAVALLEIRVASCVHCVEDVAYRQHPPHSEHSSSPESPATLQLQQDRQP